MSRVFDSRIILLGSVNLISPGGKSIRVRINLLTFLISAAVLLLSFSVSNGQSSSSQTTQEDVATVLNPKSSTPAAANVPVFTDYRGVTIGMTADQVRAKLERLNTGDRQDFLAFSEHESAQIYYDKKGKVTAVSIDYFGDTSKAPTPEVVLGMSLTPKADGSMYKMNRYRKAGFWVSYNRTAGDNPIVTITMQKF